MQVVVLNGMLDEAKQDFYIRLATKQYPVSIIEKLFLDVQPDGSVEVRCELHQFRPVRKMGGYCIGDPADWNQAKQAELRDTVPNKIDL